MFQELDLKSFPPVSKEEWKALAQKQLKGVDPTSLNWVADRRLPVEPYYDESDLSGLQYLGDFFSKAVTFEWKLYEEVLVADEKSANQEALQALQGGCDGVVFNIKKKIDTSVLMEGILTDICDVSVRTSVNENSSTAIANDNGFKTGGIDHNTFVIDNFETQIDGIVHLLNSLSDETHILRQADTDFFLEIASIRALRFLLADVHGKDPWLLGIHTTVPFHPEPDHQWFLNSTAGLASILGGTSSVCFCTAKGNARISRNVGNLIREESGISTYSDQCGGSYFIERLTHSIIEECKSQLN